MMSAPAANEVIGLPAVPHTFGEPPPPQLDEPEQVPHESVPPQPSLTEPQFLPRLVQVAAVQELAQVLSVWQMLPLAHVPQVIEPPQPSAYVPHTLPAGHVVAGVHDELPQRFAMPLPPQV